MLESALEKAICKYVRQCGGRAYKWVSPGCSGVPDRICVMPGGKVIFVEVKRPGVEFGMSVRQTKVASDLRTRDCEVWRISDKKEFIFRMRCLGYEI